MKNKFVGFGVYGVVAFFAVGCASSKTTEKSETHTMTTTIDTTVTVEIPAVADTLAGEIEETPEEVTITAVDSATHEPVLTVKHNRKTKRTIVEYQPPPQEVKVQATQEVKVEKKEIEEERESWMDEFKDLIIVGVIGIVVLAGVFFFLRLRKIV